MTYVALAMVSAVLFGVWGFAIGTFRGRVSPWITIAFVAAVAAVMYAVFGAASGELVIDSGDLGPALLGGTFNLIGIFLLLKAYEHGKVGIAAGITALDVLVPLIYAVVQGEPFTGYATAGVLLMLIGLASFYLPRLRDRGDATSSDNAGLGLTILLSLGAALAWGFTILILDVGTRVSVTGTLFVSEIPQVIVPLVIVLATGWRALTRMPSRSLWVFLLSGVAIALANIAFYSAANLGNIGVASVVMSTNPMITALLALVFFKEKLLRSQWLALVIVIVGACLVVA
jgi:drug/metabolite transporter (DMT)-like permease